MKVLLGGLLFLFGAAVTWGAISNNLPNMVAAIGSESLPQPNQETNAQHWNPYSPQNVKIEESGGPGGAIVDIWNALKDVF